MNSSKRWPALAGTCAVAAVAAAVAAAGAIALAAPSGPGPGPGSGGSCEGLVAMLADLPEASIPEEVATDLRFMREEEKLARDVYRALGERWGLRPFHNISRSEQGHMDAVLALIDRYGIADPVGANPPGVFVDEGLQALHDALVEQGRASEIDALKVGARIEELDIADLRAALARTAGADIRTLWQNLEKGSRNHLRAFDAQLAARGAVYEPTELDPDVYAAIAAGPKEPGLVDADGTLVAARAGRGGGGGRGGRGAGDGRGGCGGCGGRGDCCGGCGGRGGRGGAR